MGEHFQQRWRRESVEKPCGDANRQAHSLPVRCILSSSIPRGFFFLSLLRMPTFSTYAFLRWPPIFGSSHLSLSRRWGCQKLHECPRVHVGRCFCWVLLLLSRCFGSVRPTPRDFRVFYVFKIPIEFAFLFYIERKKDLQKIFFFIGPTLSSHTLQ